MTICRSLSSGSGARGVVMLFDGPAVSFLTTPFPIPHLYKRAVSTIPQAISLPNHYCMEPASHGARLLFSADCHAQTFLIQPETLRHAHSTVHQQLFMSMTKSLRSTFPDHPGCGLFLPDHHRWYGTSSPNDRSWSNYVVNRGEVSRTNLLAFSRASRLAKRIC